jgi:hypothetical protein
MSDAAFFHLYADLPRAGPGEPEDVRWALATAGTPQGARILDAGSGPGGDIGTLLEHPGAPVTAVDAHAPFVDATPGPPSRDVTAFAGDMATAEGPFDFIWCAGALYFLGVASGLAAFRPRLAEGAPSPSPSPASSPTPRPTRHRLLGRLSHAHRIEAPRRDRGAGYRILATRRLSDAAWDAYYTPLLARAAALRPGADPDLLRVILAAEAEAALWHRVKDETGYLLVLAVPE